jgi:alpha-L-fucosidase 2
MLLQSYYGELHFLPALPSKWSEGKVRGLRARGAFTVNLEWKNSKLFKAEIKAQKNNKCKIKKNFGKFKVKDNKGNEPSLKEENNLVQFETEAGKTYIIETVNG